MTPERWQQLKPLYDAAVDLSHSERAQFVARHCAHDPELQAQLEELLHASDQPSDSRFDPLVNFRSLLPEPPATLAEGVILLGRFKIIRLLGSGGMGDVYEANDLLLRPGRIALKTIRAAIAESPSTLARFKEEVVLARQINGNNVCRIHELYLPGKDSGSPCAAFLTMEYLEGVTLASRIAAHTGSQSPIEIKQACLIADQLCAALQAVHDAGVIHRDLKPNNIMLVPRRGTEEVVLMDFGLARRATVVSTDGETGLSVPGTIMGAPEYMAPEQFEGRESTAATDIYALGIVLYELATGRRPFAGDSAFATAVRRARRPDPPSSVRRGLPNTWDEVIARCLEYDPERRYQSPNEVRAALHKKKLVIVNFRYGQRIALTYRALSVVAAIILALFATTGFAVYKASRGTPISPEGKRWYDRGVSAFREGAYLKSSKALTEAIDHDPKFALAHARLAEAWAELDFTGQADHEMLIVAGSEDIAYLSDLDRKYIDAVRSTLLRNYSAAAQDYEQILKRLPDDQRASGYVDLGRAYEKAGRIQETIASYQKAARLHPDDPAPFVHLGIWESRQRNPVAAEAAFARAEQLYQASSTPEGLADVAYQRGYAANETGGKTAYTQASDSLNKSMVIARQVPSVQMEVRSLSQLSSVEANYGSGDKAVDYANECIRLAREKGLQYWVIDGLMRLGNAYAYKEDFPKAESSSQDALRMARQDAHPRLEADSEFTLASIRDEQGKSVDEQISLSQHALQYYRDFGFMNEAADSMELVIRGFRRKGDLEQARHFSAELLALAKTTNSLIYLEQAEETLGAVWQEQEAFPDALAHFQRAYQFSQSTHQLEGYEALHCADVLWRLGRYSEAKAMLVSIPADFRKRTDIGSGIKIVTSQMQLSQRLNTDALAASLKALRDYPNLPASQEVELRQIVVLAGASLGRFAADRAGYDELLSLARSQSDEGLIAQAELTRAEALLSAHKWELALSSAGSATRYFRSKDKKDSEWRALFCLAQASRGLGDVEAFQTYSSDAIASLNSLKSSWPANDFSNYMTRPDYKLRANTLNFN